MCRVEGLMGQRPSFNLLFFPVSAMTSLGLVSLGSV
jgi:hypothetical protein